MSTGQRVRGQVVRMSTDIDRCLPSKPRVLCLVCARRLPEGSPVHRDRVTLDASAIELGAIGCRMWVGEVQPRLSQAGRAWVGRYFSSEARRP